MTDAGQPAAGWTVDTLRIHLRAEILAVEKAATIAFTTAEAAREKAEAAQEHRNQTQNDWHSTVTALTANLMTRMEYDRAHADLVNRVNSAINRIERLEGIKTGTGTTIGMVVSIVGAALSFVTALSLYFHSVNPPPGH